jgi:peptidyl-tRNA hydrolase, PTH1 family
VKIVAGLGNPGPKYETTRHNAGFLAIDRLVDEWKAVGPSREGQGELYQATVAGEKVLLVKPQTYMNHSGKCVAPIFRFYKCAPTDLIVIYDEIDLRPLVLRVKTGGGNAGHNGLRSLDAHLGAGSTGYHRIRIGVGRPDQSRLSVADYVLHPFDDGELEGLDRLLDDVKAATELLIQGKSLEAMNRFNGAERGSGSGSSK